MLLYAITARILFHGNEQEKRLQLMQQAQKLAQEGIEYLQIREKDLPVPELASLAEKIVQAVRSEGVNTHILLNGPPEIALQTGCDGIHLAGNAPPGSAEIARQIFANSGRKAIISAACHSPKEVSERRRDVDLLLFAPVFEKSLPGKKLPGTGLAALSSAVEAADNTPVLALGGVTVKNAPACLHAGAEGIAAIRLFMANDWLPLKNLK